MERAILAILDENESEKETIDVQFNPSEYSVTRSARYTGDQPVAQNANAPQFVAEEDETLKFKLTLDGFMKKPDDDPGRADDYTKAYTLDPEEAQDVYADVAFFRALVSIDASLHKPPLFTFSWGSFYFKGYATNLDVNYTMFASNGKPIRASIEITAKSADVKKIPKQSPDRTKRKVLTQGVPLYMVAHEAYNDSSQWRRIAVANGIRNPRKLNAGMVLKVPPMEFESK